MTTDIDAHPLDIIDSILAIADDTHSEELLVELESYAWRLLQEFTEPPKTLQKMRRAVFIDPKIESKTKVPDNILKDAIRTIIYKEMESILDYLVQEMP